MIGVHRPTGMDVKLDEVGIKNQDFWTRLGPGPVGKIDRMPIPELKIDFGGQFSIESLSMGNERCVSSGERT